MEMARVDEAIARIRQVVVRLAASPQDDVVVEAAASRLHSLYRGIERCCERIARHFEGQPSGDAWHRELLDQMSRDIPGIRAAVLTPATVSRLHELRGFRHRFTNIYGFDLQRELLQPLLDEAPGTWLAASDEIRAFVAALRAK